MRLRVCVRGPDVKACGCEWMVVCVRAGAGSDCLLCTVQVGRPSTAQGKAEQAIPLEDSPSVRPLTLTLTPTPVSQANRKGEEANNMPGAATAQAEAKVCV